MNYSTGASVQKTATRVADLPGAAHGDGAEKRQTSVASFAFTFGSTAELLFRVALYAVLASTAIAFLIPSRYRSTAHLMPPDNQGSSGLAMAAAAMAGSASGSPLGGMAS